MGIGEFEFLHLLSVFTLGDLRRFVRGAIVVYLVFYMYLH